MKSRLVFADGTTEACDAYAGTSVRRWDGRFFKLDHVEAGKSKDDHTRVYVEDPSQFVCHHQDGLVATADNLGTVWIEDGYIKSKVGTCQRCGQEIWHKTRMR